MPLFDHFDLLAPLYDRLVSAPDEHKLDELLGLPVEGRLLDAGGGTGRIAERLQGHVGQITIADASLPMLRQAYQKACCDIAGAHTERLPFASDSFARVIVIDAYHHLADHTQSLSELMRVVQPGGRLIIEEPDIDHLGVKFVALVEKVMLMRSHFERAERIADRLDLLGTTVEIVKEGYTYWIIASKKTVEVRGG